MLHGGEPIDVGLGSFAGTFVMPACEDAVRWELLPLRGPKVKNDPEEEEEEEGLLTNNE